MKICPRSLSVAFNCFNTEVGILKQIFKMLLFDILFLSLINPSTLYECTGIFTKCTVWILPVRYNEALTIIALDLVRPVHLPSVKP